MFGWGLRRKSKKAARIVRDQIRSKIWNKYFGEEQITIIKPAKGWRMLDFRELWAYRELLWTFVLRDIKVQYKQTVLGCAWAIIQPVMGMVIFSVIFGRWAKIPSEGYPYPIFVYAGLLPWAFFANSLSSSANSVVGSAGLITKVYFPRLIVPLASVGSGILDFLISSGVMLCLMLYYQIGWHLNLLAIPLLMAATAFAALGVGILLSALNVAYRDFRYVIPFLLQIWMYATPIIYPVGLVPGHWRWVLYLNPMAGTIDGFRSAFLGKPFNLDVLGLSFCASVIFFIIGIAYFEKTERGFADVI